MSAGSAARISATWENPAVSAENAGNAARIPATWENPAVSAENADHAGRIPATRENPAVPAENAGNAARIPVTRANPLPEEALQREFHRIIESRRYTNNGPDNRRLAAALRSFTGVRGCALVSSGHQALQLALEAVGVAHNPVWNEVITTPFTFPSTIEAILREGLRPVYCDVDPATGCLDPARIEEKITQRTCCILPVHVYGNLCDDRAIGKIAARHHLPVIYDAAHAFGETLMRAGRAQSVMSLGSASCCSFHATKVFTTVEGGAVFSQDAALTRRVAEIANFGIRPGAASAGVAVRKDSPQFSQPGMMPAHEVASAVDSCRPRQQPTMPDPGEAMWPGTNAKMDEFHAAVGLVSLPYYREMTVRRRIRYERYLTDLSALCDSLVPLILPQGRHTGCAESGSNGGDARFRLISSAGEGCASGGCRMGGKGECRNTALGEKCVSGDCGMIERNYGYCPVLVQVRAGFTRDELYEALRKEGICARRYFWPLVSEMPGIAKNCCGGDCARGETWPGAAEACSECGTRFGIRQGRPGDERAGNCSGYCARRETPVAWDLASRVLCLPMYCDLSLEDVDRICAVIWRLYRERHPAVYFGGVGQEGRSKCGHPDSGRRV